MAAPVYPHFLAEEFKQALAPDQANKGADMKKGHFRIAPLIVMSLEDLEHLEFSLRSFSLCQLLSDYSEACWDRLAPLNNFLAVNSQRYPLYQNRRLAAASTDIIKETMHKVFPQAVLPQIDD